MANVDHQFGLQPLMHPSGENRVNTYIATTAATFYKNDPLTMVAAGTVEKAGAGDVICGVAAETVKAASAGDKVLVYDDPNTRFIIQSNAAIAAADIGQLYDIAGVTGDTTFDRSKEEIDYATAAEANGQLKVLGLYETPDNAWGADAVVIVVINEHFQKAAIAGI